MADEICFNLPSARGAVDNSHVGESTERRECFLSPSRFLSFFTYVCAPACSHGNGAQQRCKVSRMPNLNEIDTKYKFSYCLYRYVYLSNISIYVSREHLGHILSVTDNSANN